MSEGVPLVRDTEGLVIGRVWLAGRCRVWVRGVYHVRGRFSDLGMSGTLLGIGNFWLWRIMLFAMGSIYSGLLLTGLLLHDRMIMSRGALSSATVAIRDAARHREHRRRS